MNKIYKTIRNRKNGSIVVASELAKGNKKSLTGKLLALGVGAMALSATTAMATTIDVTENNQVISFAEAGLNLDEDILIKSDTLYFVTHNYNDYDSFSKKLKDLLITVPGSSTQDYPLRGIELIYNGTDTIDFGNQIIHMDNIKINVDKTAETKFKYGIRSLSNNVEANNIDITSQADKSYGINNTNSENFDNRRDELSTSYFKLNNSVMNFYGDKSYGVITSKTSINEDSFAHVELNNSTINLYGDSSYGFSIKNASVSTNQSNINLSGNKNIYGALIYSSGSAVFDNNSHIIAESNESVGIYLSRYILKGMYADDLKDEQVATLNNNSTIEFQNGYGIFAVNGNDIVNVDNSSKILSKILIKANAAKDEYINHPTNITLNVSNDSIVEGATITNENTTSSINLSSNSIWNVTGDSTLTNLNIENANVDFKKDSDNNYITTQVDNVSGSNAIYNFAVDVVNQESSKLVINKSSSGAHIVRVMNNGAEDTTGAEKVLLVEDKSDANATFKNDDDIELGGYTYEVKRDDENSNNWILAAKKGTINDTAKSITGLASSSYLLNQAEMSTLRQRVGDIAINSETTSSNDVSGVWGRVYGGRYKTRDNNNMAKVNMNYYGFQLGGDLNTLKESSNNNYIGVFIGHTTGKPDYVHGDSTIESWYGGFYDTFITNNNFYIDSVVKFGQYRNKYNLIDSQNNTLNGKVHSNVLTLSSEVGKRFVLKESDNYNIYIEPQGQLTWSHIGSFNTDASNGLSVKQDAYNSTVGRIAALFGSQINKKSDIYLKTSYFHEFSNDVEYTLNNSVESYSVRGIGVEIGVGGNLNVSDNSYIYVEGNYINSSSHYTGSKFNIGYRYSF